MLDYVVVSRDVQLHCRRVVHMVESLLGAPTLCVCVCARAYRGPRAWRKYRSPCGRPDLCASKLTWVHAYVHDIIYIIYILGLLHTGPERNAAKAPISHVITYPPLIMQCQRNTATASPRHRHTPLPTDSNTYSHRLGTQTHPTLTFEQWF